MLRCLYAFSALAMLLPVTSHAEPITHDLLPPQNFIASDGETGSGSGDALRKVWPHYPEAIGSHLAAASLMAPAPPPSAKMRMLQPLNDPRKWILPKDFPADGLGFKLEDTPPGVRLTVGFALEVDPKGKVTGCTIRSTSGYDELDRATCRAVSARARFAPALDRDGKPTAAIYSNRINWTA